jgi:hypothetical protein
VIEAFDHTFVLTTTSFPVSRSSEVKKNEQNSALALELTMPINLFSLMRALSIVGRLTVEGRGQSVAEKPHARPSFVVDGGMASIYLSSLF